MAIDQHACPLWPHELGDDLRHLFADDRLRRNILTRLADLEQNREAEHMTFHLEQGTKTIHWEIDLLAWAPTESSPVAALAICRDGSLEYNLRNALADSRRRYKDLVEVSSDFAWECDREGRFIFVSPGGAFGHDAEALIGRPARMLLLDDEDSPFSPFTTREKIADEEIWLRGKDGGDICVLASGLPLYDNQADWCGARGVCRDITALKERERELDRMRHQDLLLTYILRTIRDVADPQDMLDAATAVSAKGLEAAACRFYRRDDKGAWHIAARYGQAAPGAETLESHFTAKAGLIHLSDQPAKPIAVKTRYQQNVNGAIALWKHREDDWREDEIELVGHIADQLGIAVEQIKKHEHLKRISTRDSLTGLYNRRAFLEILDKRTAHVRRTGRPAAICYIDCDHFKSINDAHGHQSGDEALKRLAGLLRRHSRANDVAARLGGDEFAIWLEETEEAGALGHAGKLLKRSQALKSLSGRPDKPFGISIGVAIYRPEDPESPESLLKRADEAMYEIKKNAKNAVALATKKVKSKTKDH